MSNKPKIQGFLMENWCIEKQLKTVNEIFVKLILIFPAF